MASLRRLLKPKFLTQYLDLACRSLELPLAAAVFSEGRTLATAGQDGSTLRPDAPDAITLPLHAAGIVAGHLVVGRSDGGDSGQNSPELEAVRPRAEFLARSIEAFIDGEETRRAVTAETLDAYRELSLLHRSAVAVNESLERSEVAAALLKEFEQGASPAEFGIVFGRDPDSNNFSSLRDFPADGDSEIENIAASRLFREIIESGKGEIVNNLPTDQRWQGEVPGLAATLVVPLMSHDYCSGALVLGASSNGIEFSAGDLRRAATLASVVATALHNARLFEEVVDIKNYNEFILQNLSNGVITLDLLTRITTTNAAACRIFRCQTEDLVGQAISSVLMDENDWVLDSVSKAMSGEDGSVWLDKDIRLSDGEAVPVNLTVVPLKNVEQEAIGSMLVLEDITREKWIKGTMARFMSDGVVEKLLDVGESMLGGTSQEATILFCDIRNFTGLSELLNPRDMVGTLNDYFTEMVDVIFERGGTLDKFIGDAIMAVFGAPFVTPSDPDHAVAAAIEMMVRLREFNLSRNSVKSPPLGIGIGINSGVVVAGTIGSPKRMDYTVIGDHVNLAARIETANKYYGTRILVSEHTVQKLQQKYQIREIDRLRVLGRVTPVAVFEVLDYHTESTFPQMNTVLSAFEHGLAHYRRREWTEGAKSFTTALQANPNDRPTQIFLTRCWAYIGQPPNDSWTDVTDAIALH